MTNTSYFDENLLNSTTSQGRRRATSFDLVLFRIPKTLGNSGVPQKWDSGVGYDYYDYGNNEMGSITPNGSGGYDIFTY